MTEDFKIANGYVPRNEGQAVSRHVPVKRADNIGYGYAVGDRVMSTVTGMEGEVTTLGWEMGGYGRENLVAVRWDGAPNKEDWVKTNQLRPTEPSHFENEKYSAAQTFTDGSGSVWTMKGKPKMVGIGYQTVWKNPDSSGLGDHIATITALGDGTYEVVLGSHNMTVRDYAAALGDLSTGMLTAAEIQDKYGAVDLTFESREMSDYPEWTKITAKQGGTECGFIAVWTQGKLKNSVKEVWTDQDMRHQGVATQLWNEAKQQFPGLKHSKDQTDSGSGWASTVGAVGEFTKEELIANYVTMYGKPPSPEQLAKLDKRKGHSVPKALEMSPWQTPSLENEELAEAVHEQHGDLNHVAARFVPGDRVTLIDGSHAGEVNKVLENKNGTQWYEVIYDDGVTEEADDSTLIKVPDFKDVQ